MPDLPTRGRRRRERLRRQLLAGGGDAGRHAARDRRPVYQELASTLKAPDTRERFLAQGALASGMPPEEFAAFVKREAEKWAKVAKAAQGARWINIRARAS